MSFLAPLFLAGLAAVAVPILVHLIQRERRNVVEFPSLMFVRRIPFQSVERRRIHNWRLLLLRLAGLAAIVTAFSRPFVTLDPVAAAVSGDRDVVILIDRSASMGYGDRWSRAQAEAARVVDSLSGGDRATLVLFDDAPEETVRTTADRGTLRAAIDSATVTSGATRFAPALRLAQSRLSLSGSARKEAVFISDFQRGGWTRQEEIALPEGATFTPVNVGDEVTDGISVTSVGIQREPFSGAERVTLTTALINRGGDAVGPLDVSLDVDGRVVDRQTATLEPHGAASVTFAPVTIAEAHVQGVIRAGSDRLPHDNNFYFVLSPTRPISVLVIQNDNTADSASLYVRTALDLSRAPSFVTETIPSSRVTPSTLNGRSFVVVNDAALGTAAAQGLAAFVERGGGLLLVLGERTPAGGDWPMMPGTLSTPVERMNLRGATLGYLDYSHPIFEGFKDPRSGSFAAMRFLKYRRLSPASDDHVLARFDDGAAALVERRVGSGRVLALTSTLDGSWNDVPRQAMYVPLIHEIATYLAQHQAPAAWETVGRRFDLSAPVAALVREGQISASAATGGVRGVVVAPSGRQVTLGAGGAESIVLAEQGFYSVRVSGTGERRPYVVAVNVAPEESDLTSIRPEELAASMSGHLPAGQQAMDIEPLTPVEMEKRQSIWWFLLVAGLVALLAEAALSNRLSARAGGMVAHTS